jgi:hypothetical protein
VRPRRGHERLHAGGAIMGVRQSRRKLASSMVWAGSMAQS